MAGYVSRRYSFFMVVVESATTDTTIKLSFTCKFIFLFSSFDKSECNARKMSSEGVAASSTSSIGSNSNSSSSTGPGVGGSSSGILLDAEDRSSTSPSLPSLSGLPLRIRSASLPALIELCITCFGTLKFLLKYFCLF